MNTVVGSNIKKLRDARSWTQAHLAAAAAVDERTVQRAEAGQPIAAESLQSIAGAFDVPLEALRRDEVAEAAARELKHYDTIPNGSRRDRRRAGHADAAPQSSRGGCPCWRPSSR